MNPNTASFHLTPEPVRENNYTTIYSMEGEKKNWRILRNDKVGRYVVAGRDLKAGDIIFSKIPFVYGPKADTPPICLGCYSPADGTTLCQRCFWPVCSPECSDIPAHRDAECRVFSEAGVRFQPVEDPTSPCRQYECITHLRLLLAKDANTSHWESEMSSMEAHNDIRRNEPVWQMNQVNVVEYLRGPCKLAERYSEELIHTVCGIIEINAFEGRSSSGYAIRAIYPQLAMISHNCIANTTHSIVPVNENGEEFRMYVRAAVDIKENAELFVTYTHSLAPTMLRREHLRQGKYFDCNCARCADPTELGTHMSTLKCTKCDNGIIMSTNPLDFLAEWKCTHCPNTIQGPTVLRILHTIQCDLDSVEASGQDSSGIEARERLLRKYRSVLHPRHAQLCQLRHALSQMYGRMEGYMLDDLPDILLERKVEMCQELMKVVDVVEPGHSRLRGMTLYELHAPVILLARNFHRAGLIDKAGLRSKLEEAVKLLEEAASILKLEPPQSPEGIIGQVAQQSLKQLKENLDVLVENA